MTRYLFVLASICALGVSGPKPASPSNPVVPRRLDPAPAQTKTHPAKKVYVCPSCGQDCDNLVLHAPGRCPNCGMRLIAIDASAARVKRFQQKGTVAILLFPGVVIIDFAGPWEVFGEAGYKVITVAAKAGPLHTSYGQTIIPDYTFANCPAADIFVLPGGPVPTLEQSDPMLQWIRKKANESAYTMSVCTGVYWLAQAGLLDGKSATTMFGMYHDLARRYPKIHVVSDKRFVDNGKIITTAGLSAGIDGAFHLVEKLQGASQARSVALGMEYNWQPDSNYARGNFADKYLAQVDLHLPDDVHATMLSNEGDLDHWELRWSITTTKYTAKDIMDAVERGLAARWTKVSSQSGDSLQSTWSFPGDNGAPWTAACTAKKEAGKITGTIVLARGGK